MSVLQLINENHEDEEDYGTTLQDLGENATYTLDDAMEHIGVGLFQVKVLVIVGLSWMADASEMMILSILSPILKCEWNLTPTREASISTVVFLGVALGSPIWGIIGDRFGRKRGLCGSTSIIFIFGAACSVMPSYPWMLVFRLLMGFGIGGLPQANVIIVETFPIQHRGKAGLSLALFWSTGSVFSSVMALLVIPAYSWRYFLLAAVSPVLLFLLASIWLPESPRYLLTKGKHDQLTKDINHMCQANGKTVPQGTLDMKSGNDEKGETFTQLFGSEWRRTIFLLVVIWLTMAFGYYGVAFLTTSMSQKEVDGCNPVSLPPLNLNSTTNTTKAASSCRKLTTGDYKVFIWNTAAEFPGLLAALILIDVVGRRKALVIQFAIGFIFFLSLAICTTKTVSIVFLFIVRGTMLGGFQSVFVYTEEVLPTNIRAAGVGVCSMFARIGSMLTPLAAQVLIEESFYYVVAVYAVMIFICLLCSLFLNVETQGKALADSLQSAKQDYHSLEKK